MSDSASASKSFERAIKELDRNDCPKHPKGQHQWDAPIFYGAKKCSRCQKVVYTK